jgi:polyhydroxyalkanoate synthesis regulator phasin
LTSFVEQLVSYVINPLGLVLLTRERIQDTLEEAAARGRITRTDATEIAAELVRRGRVQTEELLADAERLIGRGRDQLDSAAMRSRFTDGMDRIVRTADRARRTIGVGPSFPILGYDELTAAQVNARLKGLSPTELRRVREYERRHANRKSVLDSIERALA